MSLSQTIIQNQYAVWRLLDGIEMSYGKKKRVSFENFYRAYYGRDEYNRIVYGEDTDAEALKSILTNLIHYENGLVEEDCIETRDIVRGYKNSLASALTEKQRKILAEKVIKYEQ